MLAGSVRRGQNGMHMITFCGPSSAVYSFSVPAARLRLKKGVGMHSLVGHRSINAIAGGLMCRLPPRDMGVLHLRTRRHLRPARCRTR